MIAKITEKDWFPYFPLGTPRPEQIKAINFALNAYLVDGKRYVIAECPTGTGKSAIAVTISRFLAAVDPPPDDPEAPFGRGSYVLTTQKVLQTQYLNDFKKFDMESIKSSSNFKCRYYTEQSCAESLRVLTKLERCMPPGSPFVKQCKGACAYKEAKRAFIEAEMGCTNFSYFLAETMYGGALTPRQLLVCDEAHGIEAEISKFIAIKIEPGSENEVVKVALPSFSGQEDSFAWTRDFYRPALQKHIAKLTTKIEKQLLKSDKMSRSLQKAMKENEFLDKQLCKLNRFIDSYEPRDWVLNQQPGTSIEFKPVDVSRHCEWYLFKHAPRVLLLSATILDSNFYCETLGIPTSQAAFISFDSPFPAENRPIHYMPVGRMSADNIDRTLPAMVEMVKAILEQHKGEKGVIFAHSYKIVQALKDGIRDKRLLFQNVGNDREKILLEHTVNSGPTVLVSPSMTEGVDLRDDLSRFQIFCKIPYPYLGDEWVKRKMSRTPKWTSFITARTMVQAAGRSIRNEKDHAASYILDGSWEWFYKQNRSMFPEYFRKSLVDG